MSERSTRRVSRAALHDEHRRIAREGAERLISTVPANDGTDEYEVTVETLDEPRMETR